MARIREDLVGSVLVTHPGATDPIVLVAGSKVPEGIEVGAHVLEPEHRGSGSTGSNTPPQSSPDAAAKAAAKAAKKVADKAAKKAGKPEPTPTPPPAAADPTAVTPPPLNGAGSGKEAWREYATVATKAAGLSIEIPEDATRTDIVDALKSAGVRTE